MADLIIQLNERITIDGVDRGVQTVQTIQNITSIDNRILTCPTGSYTGLFYFSPDNIDAALFTTSSFKYGRITNKSNTTIKLQAQTYGGTYETFFVSPYSSFILSTALSSGSNIPANDFTCGDYITEILVEPTGSAATIEYFIATT